MSKLKNMPGAAWLVIGVCVTALVLPSAAYAAGALKFTGIEGTSTNKADVTPAGQLLTAPVASSKLFGTGEVSITPGEETLLHPVGEDAVVNSVLIDQDGNGASYPVYVWVAPSGGCADGTIGWNQSVSTPSATALGFTEVTLPTGVPVPNGDYLCGYQAQLASSIGTSYASVAGYYLPAGSVAASSHSPVAVPGVAKS